jgi:hypothetical protein
MSCATLTSVACHEYLGRMPRMIHKTSFDGRVGSPPRHREL